MFSSAALIAEWDADWTTLPSACRTFIIEACVLSADADSIIMKRPVSFCITQCSRWQPSAVFVIPMEPTPTMASLCTWPGGA